MEIPKYHLTQKIQSTHFAVALLGAILIILVFPHIAYGQSTDARCVRDIKPAYVEPGRVLIETVFSIIQTLLTRIGATLYLKITNTQTFQNIVAATIGLYVMVYGLMVTLNLVSHSLAEIGIRLLRITICYVLLAWGTNGYLYFDKYVVTMFLGGMNELISYVTAAAGGTPVPYIPPPVPPAANPDVNVFLAGMAAPTVDPNAVSVVFTILSKVLTPLYFVGALHFLLEDGAGPLLFVAMFLALVQFIKMTFGAVVAYVKAIVGLSFLFGIAPFFIIFMLFQPTRDTFFRGWLNTVVAFAITPVLLFAFLSFFAVLIDSVLTNMFYRLDFCMEKNFSLSGTPADIHYWRPIVDGQPRINNSGPPAISVMNILYFWILCHLGAEFNKNVNGIAQNIAASGVTPGTGVGSSFGQAVRNGVLGKRGTGKEGSGPLFGLFNSSSSKSISTPLALPRPNLNVK